MAESKYYRQIRIPLTVTSIQRVALAKAWANKNKRRIHNWPGFKYVTQFFA